LQLPFNFSLVSASWKAPALAKLVADYEAALPAHGWPNWVLGNHDQVRIATRAGKGPSRLAAMLLLTLRGTPTIYYGDEIGIEQEAIPPERIRDPVDHNLPGRGLGRDGCRTPMQWSANTQADFSTVEPWLPLQESWRKNNVEMQAGEPHSLLQLHRALITLRRKKPALVAGVYHLLFAKEDILIFSRVINDARLLVALNFSDAPAAITFEPGWEKSKLVLSSYLDRYDEVPSNSIDLRPFEGLIFEPS
jgi:alpha-glucosidase